MEISDEIVQLGFELHGHKCPAMPLGLKTAEVAMDALGFTQKSKAGELFALVELGDHHCAGCFGDGVQMMAGTTFGKGNIRKTYKGKFGLILIDRKNKRAAHVVAKGKTLLDLIESDFMNVRKSGVAPQNVKWDIAKKAIENVLHTPKNEFKVNIIENVTVKTPKSLYNKFLCDNCGDVVVAKYAVDNDEKHYCKDCVEDKANVLYDDNDILVQINE